MKYYQIPGTVGYTANSDGDIFNPNKELLKTYLSKDGYLRVGIKTIEEGYVTVAIQRLIAMSQIKCPGDFKDYTVNHLDLNKLNNKTLNLEWSTVEENNKHAAMFRTDLERPLVLARSPSGDYRYFKNIQHVGLELNISELDVWKAVKNNDPILGWYLEHNKFDTPKPKELQSERISCNDGIGTLPKRPIKVLDTKSGQVVCYCSLKEAARQLNTNASHLYQSMNSNNSKILKLFRKQYIIACDSEAFPQYTELQLNEARSRGKREVVVYNIKKKRIEMFDSAAAFYKTYGLSKKAVTTTLKSNKIREISNFIFSYVTEESTDKLKAYLERPGTTYA